MASICLLLGYGEMWQLWHACTVFTADQLTLPWWILPLLQYFIGQGYDVAFCLTVCRLLSVCFFAMFLTGILTLTSWRCLPGVVWCTVCLKMVYVSSFRSCFLSEVMTASLLSFLFVWFTLTLFACLLFFSPLYVCVCVCLSRESTLPLPPKCNINTACYQYAKLALLAQEC